MFRSYSGGPTLTGLTCKYWTRLTSLAKDNTIVYLFNESLMKKKSSMTLSLLPNVIKFFTIVIY
jgi:hypothetical protein